MYKTKVDMEIKEEVLKLETVFFSTLDALRGIWKANNASSVLLSLVFFKRMLALNEEAQIDFLETESSDYIWAQQFQQTVVEQPQKAAQNLISTLAACSSRNPLLKNIFAPLIVALEEEQKPQLLIQAILMLEELDFSSKAIPISTFGTFFNESLYRTALRADKDGIRRTTPKYINDLIVALANPQGGELIFDPTAGQGSSLVAFLNKLPNIDIIAQEQHIHTWALCRMNLILNGAYHAQVEYGNSLIHDRFSSLKVDLAIAHFSFGQYIPTEKIKQQAYINIPFEVNTPHIPSDSLFLQLMLSKLNKEGKMIVILPIQTLDSDKEARKLREFLIRRDLLEAVITLPYGLLYTKGIPICILVINKNKAIKRREHILFINGANLNVQSHFKSNRALNDQQITALAQAFHYLDDKNSELKECVALVPLHHIILNQYNLDAKRYASPFIAQLNYLDKKGQLIQLKSIIHTDKPSLWFDETPHQNIPYIRPQDLGSSISNYLIDVSTIPNTNEVKRVAGQLIKENMLLVNRSGKYLRTSYFKYHETPVLVNEDIMTFRIDENIVLIEYLILQLHDSLFLQQVDMYKRDYQHRMISEEQFETLQINLPSVLEQARLIKETKIRLLQEEEKKVELLRNDLNLGKQRAQSEQYKIISSLQHELGNRLPAVLTEMKNLKDYLSDKTEEQSPIAFSDPIFPVFEGEDIDDVDKLSTVMERMESILVHCIKSLDSTGDIIKADRSKLLLEPTNVKNFLENIQHLYAQDQGFKIHIEVEEDERGQEIGIHTKIDQTQLTTVFTNLIDNAKRHGFTHKNKHYTVHFSIGLSPDQQEVIIIYKNDGKGFPSNFSFEDFIGYGQYAGETGHSGIGGYLIHQIIDNHNGHISYKKNIDRRDPFKVQFEITLPVL